MKRASGKAIYLIGITLILLISISAYRLISAWPVPTVSQVPEVIAPVEETISPISIKYLRNIDFKGSGIKIEKALRDGSNYERFIASYISDGNKIFGMLTVPKTEPPEGGFPAIVFNHGYIPPAQYITTEKYVSYVDYLAGSGFVVFKIDLRGHGESEGEASGSYFSNGYTVDAINAVKSLQNYSSVNSSRIGIWGHSMSGNLVLRAMLVSEDIKAGVIWAGAVYSYEDFGKYRINDNSYFRRPNAGFPGSLGNGNPSRETSEEVQKLRESPELVDFNSDFWSEISLTKNIGYLNSPIQIHHSVNDAVVNIGYSRDLVKVLEENNKKYEFYEYSAGGHNIESPYFEEAMKRTVEFFRTYL